MPTLEHLLNKLSEELKILKEKGLSESEKYKNMKRKFNQLSELIDQKIDKTIKSYKSQNLRFEEKELKNFLKLNIPKIYREDGTLDPKSSISTFIPVAEESDAIFNTYKEIKEVVKVKLLRYFNQEFNEWNLEIILNRKWLTLEKEKHDEITLDDHIAFLTFKDEIRKCLASFTANNLVINEFSNWNAFLEIILSKKLFYHIDKINWINFRQVLGLVEEEFEFHFIKPIKVKIWNSLDPLNSDKLFCRYIEFKAF